MLQARNYGLCLREFEERFSPEDIEEMVAIENESPTANHWIISGNLMTLLANYIRKEGTPAYRISDVYSFLDDEVGQPRDEDALIEAKFHAFALAHNASLKSKGAASESSAASTLR